MSDTAGIRVGDTVQVADDLHGFGSFIGTRGVVTIVCEDGTVVFEAGEGLAQIEYRFPMSSLSKLTEADEATLSKSETVAPNSSAPLTGWTRDWPEYRGWSWAVRGPGDEPEAVRSYLEADNLLSHYTGDDEIRSSLWPNAMFHPMAQPPSPRAPEGHAMNDRLPYREEGEQAEPPEPRVDYCRDCKHSDTDGKPTYWKCMAPGKSVKALELVAGPGERVKLGYCENIRKMGGLTCDGFVKKLPALTKSRWWKFWA